MRNRFVKMIAIVTDVEGGSTHRVQPPEQSRFRLLRVCRPTIALIAVSSFALLPVVISPGTGQAATVSSLQAQATALQNFGVVGLCIAAGGYWLISLWRKPSDSWRRAGRRCQLRERFGLYAGVLTDVEGVQVEAEGSDLAQQRRD